MTAHKIRSAGCLIIGDEVLNAKIRDSNSYEFAKLCFNTLNIPLKKVLVCSDEIQDIKDLIKVLDSQVDFIITSGGLGSTHDDVTYQAIAEYYNVPYELDHDVVDRMKRLRQPYLSKLSNDQLMAFYKMATLPKQTKSVLVEKIFSDDNLWFPIVGIQSKVYILPGIPQLFVKLMNDMLPLILPRTDPVDVSRTFIKTSTGESEFAPFLTDYQARLDSKFGVDSVKLGSYPHIAWKLNTISIIVKTSVVKTGELDSIHKSIIDNIGGNAQQIDQTEEDKLSNEDPSRL
jgi:molybdopterin-biosynthesis enzyme MoeA-like protein